MIVLLLLVVVVGAMNGDIESGSYPHKINKTGTKGESFPFLHALSNRVTIVPQSHMVGVMYPGVPSHLHTWMAYDCGAFASEIVAPRQRIYLLELPSSFIFSTLS